VWNKSLFRRIAVGFVLLVAGMLAAQSTVFLWLLYRDEANQPELLNAVRATAVRLEADLATTPNLDLEAYLAATDVGPPLFAILTNGRLIGRTRPPDDIYQLVMREFARSSQMPPSWETSIYRACPIVVGGTMVGILGVVPDTALRSYGPPLAVIGALLLIGGTAMAALLIGGPVRRRLGDLGRAARRVGAGDLSARANDTGADEVAEFARTFNTMVAQLEARASQLEASDQARSQLVAEVSHELMTPMTAIRGHLETIAMDDVHLDPPTRKRFVAIMMRETQRLERLIGDLLDMARLEAGGGGLDLQTVHVEDLFDAVLQHHQAECRTRGIQLSAAIEPGAAVLTGDAFRLEQAVDNLVANALRHSEDGGRIALRAEPVSDPASGVSSTRLTVRDSGEGIPAEELPLIFDRFYKARSGRRGRSQGSGLGLSIVKAIVERHGGRVWAASSLAEGTTVGLELPGTVRTSLEFADSSRRAHAAEPPGIVADR
jgi:signal transduction histidine kinase